MVIVYLKNGEKAPLPDATRVRVEHDPAQAARILYCYFHDQEVGQFKWDEVAGYTVQATSPMDAQSSPEAYHAWGLRDV